MKILKTISILILLFYSALFLSGCNKKPEISNEQGKGGEEIMETKGKIAMVLAPVDFQEREYFGPKNIFEQNGYEVATFTKSSNIAKSSNGTEVAAELIENLKLDEFLGIIFVGGPGTTVYFNDEIVLSLAERAVKKEIVVGAICIAPTILANSGVLNGKMATVFPSERNNLERKGAILINEKVVVDGNIITANGPEAAEEFGQKIVETLQKK